MGASLALFAAGAVQAQELDVNSTSDTPEYGDIVVVAQHREERLQQVPIAVTVIGGQALNNSVSPDLRTISLAAPSLTVSVYPGSSDTVSLNMRGQGIADAGQITKDGGVGLYIDGFYIARPQAALFDLGDPARVEVLRGPQGTLYGRNTTGGAINIITTKPKGEWGGEMSLAYGSRNLVRSQAILDLPAFGDLAIRGTILYSHQDGWAKNPGQLRNLHEMGQLAGRVAARWTPTDSLTIDYAWDRGRIASTQGYYVNLDLVGIVPGYSKDIDVVSPSLDMGLSKSHFTDHQLTVEWRPADNLTIRSLSSYRKSDATQFANYGYAQSYPFPGMTFTVEQEHGYAAKQYTQELQLIASLGDRLDLTGGLYYFRETGAHDRLQIADLPAAMGGYTETSYAVRARSTSKAAYLQGTLTLPFMDDRVKLTAGGRYTEDRRKAARDSYYFTSQYEFAVKADQKFDNFSPMANLAIEWTPDVMNYVRFSKGYKAGGVSENAKIFALANYGPEKVETWELGFKSQFLNRAVTLNAAAFSSRFKDIHLDFGTDAVDISAVSTLNAGRASVKGFETEIVLRPTRTFSLNAAYTYLDARIDKVLAPIGTNFDPAINSAITTKVGDDVTGYFTFPFAPKNSYNISGHWTAYEDGAKSLSLNASYSYQQGFYTQATAGPIVAGRAQWLSEARKLLNVRAEWAQPLSGADVVFALFANNLLNRRAKEFVIGIGSQVTTTNGPGGYISQTTPYSEPRVIGGELQLKF